MRPKVIMQLDISKNDTAHCWNFIIRYVAQGNLDERKHLLKKDSFSESYIIEEQNTVKLYSYLRGNVLLEHFSLFCINTSRINQRSFKLKEKLKIGV